MIIWKKNFWKNIYKEFYTSIILALFKLEKSGRFFTYLSTLVNIKTKQKRITRTRVTYTAQSTTIGSPETCNNINLHENRYFVVGSIRCCRPKAENLTNHNNVQCFSVFCLRVDYPGKGSQNQNEHVTYFYPFSSTPSVER